MEPVVSSPSVHVVPLPDGGQREQWLVEDRLHRTDGPAWVERNAAGVVVHEEWWVEGRRHRMDGPAVMEYNDAGVVTGEGWWVKGRMHRTDGPAAVVRNDAGVVVHEAWLVKGRHHRTDGPAVVVRNFAGVAEREQWRVEDKPSTPAEVFELFLANRGVAGLSPEALEFLRRNRHYKQWGEITDNEIALARLLHPTTDVRS